MYTDLYGKKRMKIALHIHTTCSDGKKEPEEAVEIFKNAGYDAIALTDHWHWRGSGEVNGMRIISGCEYNNTNGEKGVGDSAVGVYHIVAIGAKTEPDIKRGASVQEMIDKIHDAGGIAILAHPAWSLNTPSQIMALHDIDATEIYNTVSGVHASNRPYSGGIVDMITTSGLRLPLVAADDCHFYDGEETVSYIMVDVSDDKTSDDDIMEKIRNKEFYATQGPEIHIEKDTDGTIISHTSPVSKISFFSQAVYNRESNTYGEGITFARYTPHPFEKWIRAEAYDKDGKCAWSNIIEI